MICLTLSSDSGVARRNETWRCMRVLRTATSVWCHVTPSDRLLLAAATSGELVSKLQMGLI